MNHMSTHVQRMQTITETLKANTRGTAYMMMREVEDNAIELVGWPQGLNNARGVDTVPALCMREG